MSDNTTGIDYAAIAGRHGIDLNLVKAPTFEERLESLGKILPRKDVPYPIDPARAAKYYELASSNQPFGVGSLSHETVNLEGYYNHQHYERYTYEDHLSWACLIAEQQKTKHHYACKEYLRGEKIFSIGGSVIPDFYLLNARIYQQTGWQLSTVSTIIPAELFFTCHSHRFFPVTTFMRPLEQDYLQEPDIGHDVAGHVSTFTIPVVAKLMQSHGIARDWIYQERDELLEKCGTEEEQAEIRRSADELLFYAQRIYWFTVEFGLVMQDGAPRAFGAGILSSPGETTYSIDSPKPNRIKIDPSNDRDLLRLATTDYLISEFQKTYFVMKEFSLLDSLTPKRIVRMAKLAQSLPHFTWREIVPGDSVIQVGTECKGIQEKYAWWLAGKPQDEATERTLLRNLKLECEGRLAAIDMQQLFQVAPPNIPSLAIEAYSSRERG